MWHGLTPIAEWSQPCRCFVYRFDFNFIGQFEARTGTHNKGYVKLGSLTVSEWTLAH